MSLWSLYYRHTRSYQLAVDTGFGCVFLCDGGSRGIDIPPCIIASRLTAMMPAAEAITALAIQSWKSDKYKTKYDLRREAKMFDWLADAPVHTSGAEEGV